MPEQDPCAGAGGGAGEVGGVAPARLGGRAAIYGREKFLIKPASLRRRPARSKAERAKESTTGSRPGKKGKRQS
jgi:hypothetical protein